MNIVVSHLPSLAYGFIYTRTLKYSNLQGESLNKGFPVKPTSNSDQLIRFEFNMNIMTSNHVFSFFF